MQADLLKEFEEAISKYGHIGSTSTYFGNLTPDGRYFWRLRGQN